MRWQSATKGAGYDSSGTRFLKYPPLRGMVRADRRRSAESCAAARFQCFPGTLTGQGAFSSRLAAASGTVPGPGSPAFLAGPGPGGPGPGWPVERRLATAPRQSSRSAPRWPRRQRERSTATRWQPGGRTTEPRGNHGNGHWEPSRPERHPGDFTARKWRTGGWSAGRAGTGQSRRPSRRHGRAGGRRARREHAYGRRTR